MCGIVIALIEIEKNIIFQDGSHSSEQSKSNGANSIAKIISITNNMFGYTLKLCLKRGNSKRNWTVRIAKNVNMSLQVFFTTNCIRVFYL